MSRLQTLAILILLWAAVYLPALGSLEIKGEEGRRILPAITMIESGDWLVPRVGGEVYARKPPLINWLIAASFQTFRAHNEWTARLPSVLSVLALGVATVGLCASWLSPWSSLLAAIFMLTNIAMLEKGRLAEIEALYIALTGIAIVCWLSWWIEKRSRWLIWLVPFIFLGLALLTKGPLHLLFFYAVVVAVLTRAGELREMVNAVHALGILLMLAIFALWAVPFLRETTGGADVWTAQFAGRVGGQFDLMGWLTNTPRGLINLLPWVLLAPLLWCRNAGLSPREHATLRGMRLAVLVCFFGLLIIPGVLPRYTLPLIVPLCLALALAMRDTLLPQRAGEFWHATNQVLAGASIVFAIAAPFFADEPLPAISVAAIAVVAGALLITHRATSTVGLAISTSVIIAILIAIAALVVVPPVRQADNVRPFGAAVNSALPEDATLYVTAAGFQPALFYVDSEINYVAELDELPQQAEYVFLSAEKLQSLQRRRRVNIRASFTDKNGDRFLLCSIEQL